MRAAKSLELWIFLLPLAVYLATAKGYLEISDSQASMNTAKAIVHQGTLVIEPLDEHTRTGRDGHSYSKYGIGLAILFVPCVVIGDLLTQATSLPADQLAEFFASFLNSFFGAATCLLSYRVLRRLGVAYSASLAAAVAVAFGTLAWRYSVCDFSESAQMCLLLGAVYAVLDHDSKSLAAGSAAFGFLVALKIVYIAYLPILALYLAATSRDRGTSHLRDTLLFSSGAMGVVAGLLMLNFVRFGDGLETGYGADATRFSLSQIPEAVPGLLLSPEKGLFVYSPVALLGCLGFVPFARRRPVEATLFCTLAITNLALVASFHGWRDEWSWGPRYLVPAIPYWIIPLGFLLERLSQFAKVRLLVHCVIAVSILSQLAGVLVKNQELDHIRYELLTDDERPDMYPNSVAAWLLLEHKLSSSDERYALSEIGIPGTRVVDLSEYESFVGLNLWAFHMARRLGHPWIRFVPLGFIPIALLSMFALHRGVNARNLGAKSSGMLFNR